MAARRPMNKKQGVFAYVESVFLSRGRTAQQRKRVNRKIHPHFEVDFSSKRSLLFTFEICADGKVMRPLRNSIKLAVDNVRVSALHFSGQSKTQYRNLLKDGRPYEVNDVLSSYHCTVRIDRKHDTGAKLRELFDYIRTLARIENGELLRLPAIPKRFREPTI